jgi:hypothetical protein
MLLAVLCTAICYNLPKTTAYLFDVLAVKIIKSKNITH